MFHRALSGFGWRRRAGRLIVEKLDEIFPGHGVAPGDLVQEPVDRPTPDGRDRARLHGDGPAGAARRSSTSRPPRSTNIPLASCSPISGARSPQGMSCALISHILGEVLTATDRIVVMRDGKVVVADAAAFVRSRAPDRRDGRRRGRARRARKPRAAREAAAEAPVLVAHPPRATARRQELVRPCAARSSASRASPATARPICCSPPSMRRAAGARRPRSTRPSRSSQAIGSPTAFFRNGRSPRTSACARSRQLRVRPLLSPARERALADSWKARIKIRTPDVDANILSLSGGNQQKALFARALGSDAGSC